MAKNSRDAYGAEGEQKVMLIAPEKLKLVTDEHHPLYDKRVHLPVDENLVVDIMENGVIQNIVIRKNPENGDIEVCAGRQRTKAALEANKRLKKAGAELICMPCVPRRGDEATLFGLSISENELRQADSPMGRAEKMQRLIEMGRSEEQAGKRFGCSVATVKNMISLLGATAAVRNAVDSEKIALSTGYMLAKLPPDEQRAKLEKILKEAPRVAGKKRSASGAKAREIAGGKKRKKKTVSSSNGSDDGADDVGGNGLARSETEISKKRTELSEHDYIPGEDKRILDLVFDWLMGNDEAFEEWERKVAE